MITLHTHINEVHDDYGKTKGFIEVKNITFYDTEDYPIPSGEIEGQLIRPVPPCLVAESFDYTNSTAEIKMMTPVDWIPLSEHQADFFRKYFKEMEEEDKCEY